MSRTADYLESAVQKIYEACKTLNKARVEVRRLKGAEATKAEAAIVDAMNQYLSLYGDLVEARRIERDEEPGPDESGTFEIASVH